MFSVDELERLEQGGGPLVFWLLDADGLPTGGVIFDPDTRRRTQVPASDRGQGGRVMPRPWNKGLRTLVAERLWAKVER